MLSVGSTVNVLSQNCTAAAPYLVDFTSRLAGVGVQAKLTIPEIMSYAAVLDSQSQKVEMSATAFQRMIMQMFQDPAKIAKATGMDIKEFADTVKTSTNDALLMMLTRLRELGNIDVLAPMFEEMGVDGRGASSVMMSLAANIEKVKEQQIEASKAYSEATSIGKEYAIQNETVQAQLDKARQAFDELTVSLGAKLMPVMTHVISGSTALMKVIKWTIDFIAEYKWEIAALALSMATYSAALNLAIIKTKLHSALVVISTVLLKAKTVALQLCYAAVALFSGNLHKAGQEMKILFAILKLNPWALLASAIVAVIGLLVAFASRNKEASESQKVMNNIISEANEKIQEEKTKIELLITAAKNEKLSLDDRHKAIDALNKLIPNYNAQLDDTTGKYTENKQALDDYLNSLAKKYELEGARSTLEEIGKEKALANSELTQFEEEKKKAQIEVDKSGLSAQTVGSGPGSAALLFSSPNMELVRIESEIARREKIITNANLKIKAINDSYGDELQKQEVNKLNTSYPAVTKPVVDDAKYKSSKGYREAVDVATKTRNEAIEAAKNQKDPERFSIAPQPNPVTNAWGEAQNASKLPQRGPEFNITKEPELSISQKANIATAETAFNNAIATINEKYKPKATGGEGGGGGTGAPDRFKAIDNWHEGEKAQASFDNNTIQLDDTKSPEAKLDAEKAYQKKLYKLELEYINKKIIAVR